MPLIIFFKKAKHHNAPSKGGLVVANNEQVEIEKGFVGWAELCDAQRYFLRCRVGHRFTQPNLRASSLSLRSSMRRTYLYFMNTKHQNAPSKGLVVASSIMTVYRMAVTEIVARVK